MSTAIASQHNPYIIGRPIHEKAEFFGRDDLFRFIADNLNQQAQVILLHGQRRIGKSSVLAQIPNFVELDDFEFVSLSLEGQANKDLGDLLSELARDIVDQLEHSGSLVKPMKAPAKSAFKKDVSAFSETFLPKIYAALGDKNLVLLLDEFDVLEDHSPESAIEQFFPYLQSILKRHPRLYLVPVVGRRLEELPKLRKLFGQAPYQEVGLLQGKWARDLVTKPPAGMLNYAPEAIDAVIELTAGHPYLTQVLCFAVFVHLREEERRDVTRADVEGSVDKAIELGQAGLTWFRDGLPIAERVMLSAVAAAQSIAESTSLPKSPLSLLEDHGVVVTDDLRRSLEKLSNWGFIGRTGQNTFDIRIRLVHFWINKKYLLGNELLELENISDEAALIYKEFDARAFEDVKKARKNLREYIFKLEEDFQFAQSNGDFDTDLRDKINRLHHDYGYDFSDFIASAEAILQEVLEVNPNHFGALFQIVEIYLERYLEISDNSLRTSQDLMAICERIYRLDPSKSRSNFTKFLLQFGKIQILEGNFNSAREVFEKLLLVAPQNVDIQRMVEALQENYISDGKFLSFLRRLRQSVQISRDDEKKINDTIKQWRDKAENTRKYEEVVKLRFSNGAHSAQEESEIFAELRVLQDKYQLLDSDVELIHERVGNSVAARKQLSRIQYQREVDRLASEGEVSSVAKRILAKRATDLGIEPEDARRIERQVLEPYRNIQEYEQAFMEACNENYPLSDRTRDELKELQKILHLPENKIHQIEIELLENINEIASEMERMFAYIGDRTQGYMMNPGEHNRFARNMVMQIDENPLFKERLLKMISLGESVLLERVMQDDPAIKIVLATLKA